MTYDHHPLTQYLAKERETLTAFADRCKISRQQLYRIMRGENTSIERLRALSKATNNAVTFEDFLMVAEAAQ
jgi:transcriptional regulator with XRE-family HTH domain